MGEAQAKASKIRSINASLLTVYSGVKSRSGSSYPKLLTLKYLDGGYGKYCNEQNDRYTQIHRVFH